VSPRQALTLAMLRQTGSQGVTTSEFLAGGCGSRFAARIDQLRRSGWVITCERVRQGEYRYRLRGRRDDGDQLRAPDGPRPALFMPPPSPPGNAIHGEA
jgi:hypothetical protein